MAIEFDVSKITLTDFVDENNLSDILEYLRGAVPQKLVIDMVDCSDIHTSILQSILSYHLLYGCDFILPKDKKSFVLAIEGFFADSRC
jgi:hypothetical protein